MLVAHRYIVLLILFIVCFGLACLITRLLCLRSTLLDIPNERSSHSVPTPRGGGLAILIAFFGGIFFLEPNPFLAYSFVIGGGLIAVISYLDDYCSLSVKIRLIVQIIVAIIVICFLYFFNHSLSYWLILPVLFGIVWLVNLYNFMDGIDGLAGLEGIFVSLVASIGLICYGEYEIAKICFLLTVSIAGFLVWNWSPARIFMGDVGSCTLGFIFAVLILTTLDVLTPFFWFIILSVFICDTTFTLIRRILAKESWYSAHRSHAYQRLVQQGYTHRQVSGGIFLFNLCIILPLAFLSLCHPYLATGITLALCYSIWYRICCLTA